MGVVVSNPTPEIEKRSPAVAPAPLSGPERAAMAEAEDLLSSSTLRFWYYQSGGPNPRHGELPREEHMDHLGAVVAQLTAWAEEKLSTLPLKAQQTVLQTATIKLLNGEISKSSFLLEGEQPFWEVGEISLIKSIVGRFGHGYKLGAETGIEQAAQACFLRNVAERHFFGAERLAPLLSMDFLQSERVFEAIKDLVTNLTSNAASSPQEKIPEALSHFPFNLHSRALFMAPREK